MNVFQILRRGFFAALLVALLQHRADAGPRDIQIRSYDFNTRILELHNYGTGTIDLSGWRFLSHSALPGKINKATFDISTGEPFGLNGVLLDAGKSVFIHFLNDHFQRPLHRPQNEVGPFANTSLAFNTPSHDIAYAIGLYPLVADFEDPATMVDHIQWSPGGADDESADERSDDAVTAGLWNDEAAWIPTLADTVRIALEDASGGNLHGPASYRVERSLRFVRFRSIDFLRKRIEIHNYNKTDIDLSGWRFCSRDASGNAAYSDAGAFDGVTIEAESSIHIHLDDDAPPGDADRFNHADIGSFASGFGTTAFGIGLFAAPADFGNPELLADHIQWSLDGADTVAPNQSSTTAVAAGLWTAESDWIAVNGHTDLLALTNPYGLSPRGADHFAVHSTLRPFSAREILVRPAGVSFLWEQGDYQSFVVERSVNLSTFEEVARTPDPQYIEREPLLPRAFYRVGALPGSYLPAIPGERGFGMATAGGSGRHLATPSTNIYKVTNLNDSGPGSLREAIVELPGPKVIIFEVSGTIELNDFIRFGGFTGQTAESHGSHITIAGQTAPSPGITIKNHGIEIDRLCHDVVIQHLRFRTGDGSFYEGISKSAIADPITLVDVSYDEVRQWRAPWNIVIDHCSCSWGGDIQVQSGAEMFTFTNNIVSEALDHPLHPKGPHSKGLLIKDDSGGDNARNTFVAKNLFAYNKDRNPFVSAGTAAVINNLIYGCRWGPTVDDGDASAGGMRVTIAANYLRPYHYSLYVKAGAKPDTQLYIGPDNFYDGTVQFDPWDSEPHTSFEMRRVFYEPDSDIAEVHRSATPPIWPSGYVAMTAEEARAHVLTNAGARPADRDAVDLRIINEVANDLVPGGRLIASQDEVGGWPVLQENTRTLTVPNDPHEVMPSGYTRLEEWLHQFSREVEGN